MISTRFKLQLKTMQCVPKTVADGEYVPWTNYWPHLLSLKTV